MPLGAENRAHYVVEVVSDAGRPSSGRHGSATPAEADSPAAAQAGACCVSFLGARKSRAYGNKNIVDFLSKHEVVIADAFDAVRGEVNHHFVPDVEPLRMVVHGFRNESDARHVAEGRDEILAFVFLMQFAVYDFPARQFGKEGLTVSLQA
jgi:hypothetical protein